MTSQAVDALQKIHVKLKKLSTEWIKVTGNYKVYVKGGARSLCHMSSNMKEAINPHSTRNSTRTHESEEAMEALVTQRGLDSQELLMSRENISTIGLCGYSFKKSQQLRWKSHSRSWNLFHALMASISLLTITAIFTLIFFPRGTSLRI
ncbi:MAG: hypothetical protein CM15mP49_33320 [Actinomycetota bacterium]|nr:MAG: hypothetical protein CM15mP49_33320 [Actinomycetota bacterium]